MQPNERDVEPRGMAVALLAEQLGLRYVTDRSGISYESALLSSLPVEWVRSHGVLPVQLDGQAVALVCSAEALASVSYVCLATEMELEPILTEPALLDAYVAEAYAQGHGAPSRLVEGMPEGEGQIPVRRGDDLLLGGRDTPVTQYINALMLDALRQRASDMHFEPFASRMRVRFRIDGVLYEQSSPPLHMVPSLISRLKVMAHMDIAERRLPQDGMARVRVGEREVDVRVSTVPVNEGERVVLRLLDKSNTILNLAALGMDAGCQTRLERIVENPNGMFVVSGPTGSGKTTTLYAALGGLDAEHRNILTVEDPVEYQLDGIGQIQVKPKIGITFASGLRHILRQDPDVILVGETRDAETAEIAIRAALTGHLVFTTLHTNDAAGAVVRLADIGIAPYLLSACLRGILAQRLVRKLCPACREEDVVSGEGPLAAALRGKHVWRAGPGCPACTQGYRGRLGLFELLEVNETMRGVIREPAFYLEQIRAEALAAGMVPLLDDGIQKVRAGITTREEVQRAASV